MSDIGPAAVVTGAGQGIGEAIARAYAREGAKVLILDALAGNREHAQKTVDEAVSAWGRVDVLVNNAHRRARSRPAGAGFSRRKSCRISVAARDRN
jgi:NAD(P)-dependent dehydrogenase (short-subunit alcohol dehydrogenase family)